MYVMVYVIGTSLIFSELDVRMFNVMPPWQWKTAICDFIYPPCCYAGHRLHHTAQAGLPLRLAQIILCFSFINSCKKRNYCVIQQYFICPHGQEVKTLPSHGGIQGSIPYAGTTTGTLNHYKVSFLFVFLGYKKKEYSFKNTP